MILLSGFYQDPDPNRHGELLECIRRNVANGRIDALHLFVEISTPLDELRSRTPLLADPKIHLVAHGRRVTYQDLFTYANADLAGRRVIIANADIYFDQTLRRLDGYDLAGRLLCLSRWDVQPDGSATFFDCAVSQDVWIFRTPIRSFPCDFHMGVLGCDNRLAWEAENAGLAISNPSRSVRSYHLHLSEVRRYNRKEWLHGNTTPVPAGYLGTPWLWFVVPCMGRLGDLGRTIGSLLAQDRSSHVLVDYSCPRHAGRWAREHHPDIAVVSVTGRKTFRGAEARNRGATVVDDDGILCFIDADTGVAEGFSEHVLAHMEEGTFLIPDREGAGYDSVLICRKEDFVRAGGFDETFLDWGEECGDLRDALRRCGLAPRRFPASLLVPLDGHDPGSHTLPLMRDRAACRAIHARYRCVKRNLLRDDDAPRDLAGIYAAIAARQGSLAEGRPETRVARVAFSETMGYTIARMEPGVSSHTNRSRPFFSIPEPLAGRQFTQVVACAVSTIEVEFLTTGKLYVLVGNDWEGRYAATAWLCQRGIDESLPLVETSPGIGFHVWSLTGDAGERFVIPTQVMLVAGHLERR